MKLSIWGVCVDIRKTPFKSYCLVKRTNMNLKENVFATIEKSLK